jgi:hypothetical protein
MRERTENSWISSAFSRTPSLSQRQRELRRWSPGPAAALEPEETQVGVGLSPRRVELATPLSASPTESSPTLALLHSLLRVAFCCGRSRTTKALSGSALPRGRCGGCSLREVPSPLRPRPQVGASPRCRKHPKRSFPTSAVRLNVGFPVSSTSAASGVGKPAWEAPKGKHFSERKVHEEGFFPRRPRGVVLYRPHLVPPQARPRARLRKHPAPRYPFGPKIAASLPPESANRGQRPCGRELLYLSIICC